jgi:hypothetical protein
MVKSLNFALRKDDILLIHLQNPVFSTEDWGRGLQEFLRALMNVSGTAVFPEKINVFIILTQKKLSGISMVLQIPFPTL